MALQNDQGLYQYGYERRIIIVSPTTLLASLKTVSYIWNNEKKNRNFDEVNRLVFNLYEKVSDFVNDYIDLGNKLNKLTEAYQTNGRRLRDGKGNIIITAEKIRKLGGIDTKKPINKSMVEKADQQDLLSDIDD